VVPVGERMLAYQQLGLHSPKEQETCYWHLRSRSVKASQTLDTSQQMRPGTGDVAQQTLVEVALEGVLLFLP